MTLIIVVVFALFLIYPLFSLLQVDLRILKHRLLRWITSHDFFRKNITYEPCGTVFFGNNLHDHTYTAGAPLAYFTTVYKVKLKGLIDILIIISMLSPPFIGAYSWIVLGVEVV